MPLATTINNLEINHIEMDTSGTYSTNPACSHVLIVEDEPISQKIMRHFIEHAGYSCEVVGKGEDGVACMKETQYGLVFMDIGLPGDIDGTEAIRQIREHEAENQLNPTPIIAISAHLLTQDYPKVYAAGANVVLGKPTELEELRRLLRQYAPLMEQKFAQ
ncbi:MAG: response regulator [Gammaproteobacteria bacterium]